MNTMLAVAALGAALIAVSGAVAQTPASADGPTAFTRGAQGSPRWAETPLETREASFAHRGFVATRADPRIRSADGRVVYDLSALNFLKGASPDTVNPRLWRHSQLLALNGLFQVSDRIWQVRGFDAANATFVKGDHGWIVIDTLGSVETARAALELVNQTLGVRPISAIIYTHPHVDHFGGAGGMISARDAKNGRVEVLAPKGFLQAAVSENVIAGPAMLRRSAYQFGFALPKNPQGQVGLGIGPGGSSGTPSLIAPTREIDHTGESVTVDGVLMVFQLTRDTEAPVEMNVDFPEWRTIDMAENANTTQHNILTPRGAVVRDAKAWADDLTQSIALFGDSDTLIASHGWPRFGRAEIDDFLSKQRDYYAFLHDQTVRLMNDGLTGDDIAAQLKLPAELADEPYDQPFYGSLSFNSRAVYQYYLGWYDANPAHLASMPPAETARKYVAAMGGADRVWALGKAAFDQGDYAWAAELLNWAVFANSDDAQAKALLARCYDQLGWASENALWRDVYLTGAKELREGPPRAYPGAGRTPLLESLPSNNVFDVLATRLDAAKAAGLNMKLEIVFPERNERTFVTVHDGVLVHQTGDAPGPVDATLTLPRAEFLRQVLTPHGPGTAVGSAPSAVDRLAELLETPRLNFPIVTPRF